MKKTLIAAICFAGMIAVADPTVTPAPPPLVLSNINQIWDVAGEAAQHPQRIHTEALVYYCDTRWHCAFGECNGRITFLPIADCPEPVNPGQRIALDGWVIPARQQFLWDRTQFQITTGTLPRPVEISDFNECSNGCLAAITGLVEQIRFPDESHAQLNVLSGNTSVLVNVLTDTNLPLPFKMNDFVRLKGMYVPTFAQDHSLVACTLWVAGWKAVQITGTLGAGPPFELPVTPVEEILEGLHAGELVRVVGTVRSQKPGKWVTLWDNTGQVSLQSAQTEPLQFGDRVEAVGRAYVVGVEACLRDSLYHLLENSATNPAPATPAVALRLTAQIQALNPGEAARQPDVRLRAVLTWAHADTPFAYVQDASGGIRVVNPIWQETNIVPGSIVSVQGQAAPGDYVPVVTNGVIRRVGWRGFESPQAVTLEQAMTGVDDGRWIELQGFIRNVTPTGGLAHLELTTSQGEFQAWTPMSPAIESLSNSIVRLDGICSVIANSRRQLTGIQLWVPDPFLIKADEPLTTNIFATVSRPLGDLRRFGLSTELNQRIKTIGTVVLHHPGRHLYLQDGHDTLFALTQQGETLRPGDRVEIAGFSGHERGKFLLREAFFRFLAHGVEPAVLPLPTGAVNVDWDGLLTEATGTLLNVMQEDDHVRLLVRNGGSTFEADLESVDARTAEAFHLLPLGSRLALTGVYEVQHDEYDRPATFLLMLRSWSDVRILERPSWWTLTRLLVLLGIVMVVFVISLTWGILISRKNRLLRQTRDQLQITNQELESFSYSVSHDLRAPLRAIDGFSLLLLEHSADHLNDEGRDHLKRIRAAAQRMGQLIEHLLALSRHARAEVRRQEVDLSALARAIAAELQMSAPARQAEFVIAPSLVDQADPALIRAVLENLLGNAWKFSGKQPVARIEFGRQPRHGLPVYFVRDNGTGFNMAYAKRLFGAFQRLHAADEFPGTGIGLATVQRIIHRHHGRVWAESAAGQGATFYFTLSSKEPGLGLHLMAKVPRAP